MNDYDYAEYVRFMNEGDGGASFYDRTPARYNADGAPLDQREADRHYGRCPDCGSVLAGGECPCNVSDDDVQPPTTADQDAINDDCPF